MTTILKHVYRCVYQIASERLKDHMSFFLSFFLSFFYSFLFSSFFFNSILIEYECKIKSYRKSDTQAPTYKSISSHMRPHTYKSPVVMGDGETADVVVGLLAGGSVFRVEKQ